MRLVLLRVTYSRDKQKPSINLCAKHQTFHYYQQTFTIFLTFQKTLLGTKTLPKPKLIFRKYILKKIVTFVSA